MTFTFISIMACTALFTWWLSGYDTKVTGQNIHADAIRRGVRCGITLVLVGFAADQFIKGGLVEAFLCTLFLLPLAPFWVGCLTELFSRGFLGLVDSPDDRVFDPKQTPRDLARLAELVRDGRNEDALELCRSLWERPDVSLAAIETILFQIYREKFKDERLVVSPRLAEVQSLRRQKRFSEAMDKLDALLKSEPQNVAALFLRMRICAQDLQQPTQALALLPTVAQCSSALPGFEIFMRQCIDEWSGVKPRKELNPEPFESLLAPKPSAPATEAVIENTASPDELLAAGYLGTAIELLENKTRAHPDDFESWLKLAEAHGYYSRSLITATKVVEKIERNPAFNEEQIQLAKAKLREWKAGRNLT
jgi:tetratricopeptide (TPR) repeat protein